MKFDDWKYVDALEYCSKITDGTHDSPASTTIGKPLITSKHIKGRNIDFESAYLISVDDYNKIIQRSKVDQWDVIISMIGEYCGFCYVERNSKIDYAVKNVGLFKTGSKIKADWLYYYLISHQGKQILAKIKTGSSQPYLTLGALRSLKILVPADEKTIEKIIDVLSPLDEKIELNNRINAELEGMAKALYDYWFVQFDFPDANGKPYKTSGGKMVWSEELKREVPEGWGPSTLDEIGQITGGSTPSRDNESYFTTNGMAWITPKDLSLNIGNKFIKKGELDVSDEGRNSASLNVMPRGTVLMSSRAPVGYLAIARNEVTTNQGFKSFVPKSYFTTEFIYYTIKNLSQVIENNASGSTFKEVSSSVLKTIYFLAPKEQVVEMYTESVAPVFSRQELLEEENNKLAELRDWLLPMLMNGQVKVRAVEELMMAAEPEVGYGRKKK